MRLARSVAAALLTVAFASSAAAEPPPAVTIGVGETRSGDLVRTGGAVSIDGTLDGTLVLVGGNGSVRGRIGGDLILLGGRVELAPGARVSGSLLAVGGDVVFLGDAGAGTAVGGRSLTLGGMETAVLAELRTSPLERAGVSPLLFALRLFLLSVWLALSLALLRFLPRRLLGAATAATDGTPLHAALGTAVLVGALLASPLLLALLPARLAAGLVLALLASLLAAKAFGLAALFLALGTRLLRDVPRDHPLNGAPSAVAAGLLSLGAVSLLPVAGEAVWMLVSLVGIGLALRTAFGAPGPVAAGSLLGAA